MSPSLMRSRPARSVAMLLIVTQVASAAPAYARPAAAAQSSPDARRPVDFVQGGPDVQVNRTVPDVTPPPATLTLSKRPSRGEIFRARVFSEPLVPVGGDPTGEDTAALAAALKAFYGRLDRGSIAPLSAYLANHPDSPWRASLLANIGAVQRSIGAFARAMETWDEAWLLAKDSAAPLERAVADYAISHWLEVAASFGQTEVVRKRLEELAGRNVRGPAASRLAAARETVGLLLQYPDEVIASGPEALRVLLEAQRGPLEALPEPLASYRPTPAGTSLAEVAQLARAVWGCRSVRRAGRASVRCRCPLSSIGSWATFHRLWNAAAIAT